MTTQTPAFHCYKWVSLPHLISLIPPLISLSLSLSPYVSPSILSRSSSINMISRSFKPAGKVKAKGGWKFTVGPLRDLPQLSWTVSEAFHGAVLSTNSSGKLWNIAERVRSDGYIDPIPPPDHQEHQAFSPFRWWSCIFLLLLLDDFLLFFFSFLRQPVHAGESSLWYGDFLIGSRTRFLPHQTTDEDKSSCSGYGSGIGSSSGRLGGGSRETKAGINNCICLVAGTWKKQNRAQSMHACVIVLILNIYQADMAKNFSMLTPTVIDIAPILSSPFNTYPFTHFAFHACMHT